MPYSPEQINKNYVSMFGLNVEQMKKLLDINIHGPHGTHTYSMLAMQIISDAQEAAYHEELEIARQLMNRAKWVLGIVNGMTLEGKDKWTLEEAQKEV